MNVGLIGIGTVGGGTYKVLTENFHEIFNKIGIEIKVTHVADKDIGLAKKIVDKSVQITSDAFELIANKDVDLVVELIGGTGVAKDLVNGALKNGKHVVTANKALIATHGEELFQVADENKVVLAYEAAVAGGIPIIKALREGLAGNKIEWVAGIVNGTTNYILSEMKDNDLSFDTSLKQAQDLGFAEADPTFDVEGIDASHKLAILASIAFGMPLSLDGLFTDGITKLEPQDVSYARELGYAIKHLGIARKSLSGVELRVHPTLVPERCLIAGVNDVSNAVMVNADSVGTTLFYGPGAGSEPTASAVIADIVDVARTMDSYPDSWVPPLGIPSQSLQSLSIMNIEDVETGFYIRFSALDKPGVLSTVTTIMGDAGISIEAIIQREQPAGESYVNVIILTNVTKEKYLDEAVKHIEELDTVRGYVNFIRVEYLDQS